MTMVCPRLMNLKIQGQFMIYRLLTRMYTIDNGLVSVLQSGKCIRENNPCYRLVFTLLRMRMTTGASIATTMLQIFGQIPPGQSASVPSTAGRMRSRSIQPTNHTFHLPAETARHAGTIMTWPTRRSILDTEWSYPAANVQDTRKELAAVIKAIAKYEPLHLFVLDPDSEDEDTDGGYGTSMSTAKRLLDNTPNVTIHTTSDVDSLWARDTGPVFVRQLTGPAIITDQAGIRNRQETPSVSPIGLILSFNQWGRKNLPTPDSYFATTASANLSYPSYLAPLIGEGGAIEVDGEGTLLATESSLLNPNRNPGIDKATMESHFRTFFNVTKTIWLKGTRDEDVTDDHIDGLVRFATPGTVLLSRPFVDPSWSEQDKNDVMQPYIDARNVLSQSTDARGRTLRIVDVQEPNPAVLNLSDEELDDGSASVTYVNFHIVNGAVIMSAFGDQAADADAARAIAREFPGRVVEQVLTRQLAVQGGGIHCATQQILT